MSESCSRVKIFFLCFVTFAAVKAQFLLVVVLNYSFIFTRVYMHGNKIKL